MGSAFVEEVLGLASMMLDEGIGIASIKHMSESLFGAGIVKTFSQCFHPTLDSLTFEVPLLGFLSQVVQCLF